MGIFGKLLAQAKTTLSGRKDLGAPVSPPSSSPSSAKGEKKVSATGKVDVPCKNADIHVKYNDDERLLGFQEEEEKGATETEADESSQTAGLVATIYKNALQAHIEDMRKSAKNKSFDTFVRPTGKIVRPKGVSARPTELANFEKVKKEYQGFLKDGKNRIAFFRKLEGDLNDGNNAKNFRAALRDEIYTKLGFDMKKGQQTRPTYFANFIATDDMVSIVDAEILSVPPRGIQKAADNVIANYSVSDLKLTNWGKMLPDLSNLRIVPTGLSSEELADIAADYESIGMIPSEDELKANSVQQSILQPTEEKSKANDLVSSTTKYYSIRDEKGKEYFTIEFRLDGQGQPPQLKTGPELKKKLKEKNQKA